MILEGANEELADYQNSYAEDVNEELIELCNKYLSIYTKQDLIDMDRS